MPDAKRSGASRSLSGTVSFAPVGTSPHDKAAWTTLPIKPGSFVTYDESHEFAKADLKPYLNVMDRAIADMAEASRGYSLSTQRWMTGAGPPWWPQSVELPSNTFEGLSTSNERSKPVGLTKKHEYTDGDGDAIRIQKWTAGGHVAHIEAAKYGSFVNAADSIPLALNVLGHDRPQLGEPAAVRSAGDAYYVVVIGSDAHRDELLARAAANLRAIDLYDQHVVKKKADEEAAAKAAEAEEALKAKAYAEIKVAQAKRDAERDKRIAAKEAARMELHDLTRDAFAFGVTVSRADTLAEAVAKYKAAVAAVGAPIL